MIFYSSIEEIKKDFQIQDNNLEVLRKRINRIRADNHPDKAHGNFKSEESETLYHKANSAIAYIDHIKNNQSLVVIEKMAELLKVMTELIPNTKQNILEQSLESKITNFIRNYRSVYFFPKISLTVITTIVTFIFFSPNTIIGNPTLSRYIHPQSSSFASLWFLLLFYTTLLWVFTYMMEEKSKRKLSLLKIDSFQNKIFEDFLHDIPFNLESERKKEFTKEELAHFIYNINRRDYNGNKRSYRMLSLLGREIITMEIAQNVAEIIIARAEKNNVVRKVLRSTLWDTYEILNYIKE